MLNSNSGTFRFNSLNQNRILFNVLAILVLFSAIISTITEKVWVMGLPLLIIMLFVTIVNFKILYFLLFAFIPFSTEVIFKNGFSTDLPTEPLIIYLMFVYILYILFNLREISNSFFKHPLTLLVIFHVLWIGVSCFSSYNIIISFKFFLAKIWYVLCFYFLAGILIRSIKDLKYLLWCFYLSLFVVVSIVLVRHAHYNFSFKDVNYVFDPFFRNHVNYACTLALIYPYIFFAVFWYKKWSNKWIFLIFGLVFLFVAIQFSYTRAAILSIFIAAFAYYIIKYKLIKPAFFLTILLIGVSIIFLGKQNKYLRLAPKFEKTVTHSNYESLLEATYKLEDISTMERVYRWVAAFQMIKHKPINGFGPGNFYSNYKSYTVSSFRTYVSNNPERSGVHCYYLMVFVEQGIIGFSIFMLMVFYALAKGEVVYHKLKDRYSKNMVMAAILSFIIILSLLLINDMIETDKVGPFFFLAMAIITNMDLKVQGLINEEVDPKELESVD